MKEYSFLLGFVNLPFKKGQLRPRRPAGKLKRTPTKPPEKQGKIPVPMVDKDGTPLPPVDADYTITLGTDGTLYEWDGTNFIGGNNAMPTLDQFKALRKRHKVTENVRDELYLHAVWGNCVDVLKALVSDDEKLLRQWGGVLHELYRDHLPKWARPTTPAHDNTFPLIAYAELLKFVNAEQAAQLKQCLCCARFWIADKAKGRGRVQKYCSKVCADKFNQKSRETDNSNKKGYTKHRHDKAKREIINWLSKNHYEQSENGAFRIVSKVRANEIYNALQGKAKTSMKEFERIFIKPKGY